MEPAPVVTALTTSACADCTRELLWAPQVPAGHQLRLVVATQPPDTFRQYSPMLLLPNVLTPTPDQLFNLAGGIYTFSLEQSVINLSTAKEGDLVPCVVDGGPAD